MSFSDMVKWAGPADKIFLPIALDFGLSKDLGVLGVLVSPLPLKVSSKMESS